uniref:C2H2-type domain-containing protein n=1 Tax=Callorhinchus milii TaxID=7868 RepID=A0A4W3JWZ4_CALMI
MTGDTQHVYAIKDSDTDPKQQQKEGVFEHFSEKDPGEINNNNDSVSESCETVLDNSSLTDSHLHSKNKETYNQREAVIRPQQAGRIDFKSLQNRPKYSCDRPWTSSSNSTSGKSSPQSPTGKNRGKDKNKRYGKGPHHLYKLSIVNSRSNPTIGIAYPQQKVTPTKKLEGTREPVTGSYRFNVPSIPEREAELQQEDLSYNRHFQEVSTNFTSTSYTSHATVAACQHLTLKAPPQANVNVSRDDSNSNGQLQYPEFHGNGNSSAISPFPMDWHSPEKTFAGTSYGIPSHKHSTFHGAAESSKPSAQGFRPIPFQYPLPQLHEAAPDPFNGDHTHSNFVFQLSGDGQEETASNDRYSASADGRSYPQPSQQTQFVRPSSQGTQHQPALSCYKGRTDHPNDTNGAISSSGAISSPGAIPSPGAIEQNRNTFQENQTGKALRRNLTHSSLPQMHYQDKIYSGSNSSLPDDLVPFVKNISNNTHSPSRVPQLWEGGNKMFSSKDQNSAPYSPSVGNQFSYQCQSVNNLSHADHRQHVQRNGASRFPWQQIHLTSAMPNQNRIELSRQLSSQQLAFPLGASEWQECKKSQKSIPLCNPKPFHNKNHVPNEGFQNSRNDGTRQNCNTATAFPFQNAEDNTSPPLCEPRSENSFCGINEPVVSAPSRGGGHTLSLPKMGLMSASPYQSPPPSPAPNLGSSSTCSSLSPVSTVHSTNSPLNSNSEDNQVPIVVTSPNFYHLHSLAKEGKSFSASDQMGAGLLQHHHDGGRTFTFSSGEAIRETKESHLLYVQEHPYPQQAADSNGYIHSFSSEPPAFSEEQLFANSLSSANLDQLDVLLTCKQCDQNFSNVASFLDHRQYCGLHSGCHTESHETSRMVENRRFQVESTKATQSTGSKSGSDLHQSLLCLSKPCDLLLDSETAGDPKDDPFKINIFSGTGSSSISLTASDLEIDDAKLDSLINETLNGLDYQSDNAEIDSSFIEAFADDELSTTKNAGNGPAYKTKDCTPLENKTKLTETEAKQATQRKILHGKGNDNKNVHRKGRNKHSTKKHSAKHSAATVLPGTNSEKVDKFSVKGVSYENSFDILKYSEPGAKIGKLRGGRKLSSVVKIKLSEVLSQSVHSTKKNSARGKHKGFSEVQATVCPGLLSPAAVNGSSTLRRPVIKDIKKRKSGSGTWSKELIHKIVQQKNKLHKLHVKANKNLQFSLVTERLLPTSQNNKLGEYDYISDSDQETEPPSSKCLAPCLSRLSKYRFTKDHKSKPGRVKEDESWKCIKIRKTPEQNVELQSQDVTKGHYGSRFRRRSSHSSTSSDHSNTTSSSSENISSPNSTERTDSDNERGKHMTRSKYSAVLPVADHAFHSTLNIASAYSGVPIGIAKENSINHSKGAKKYALLSGRRHHRANHNSMHTGYLDEPQTAPTTEVEDKCTADSNPSQIQRVHKENTALEARIFSEKNVLITSVVATRPVDSINTKLIFDRRPEIRFSSCDNSSVEYPTININQCSSTQLNDLTTDVTDDLTAVSKKLKDSLVGTTVFYEPNVGCFQDNSSVFNIHGHDDSTENSTTKNYCGHRELENQHQSDIFPDSFSSVSSHLEGIFFCQNESNVNSLEKNHIKQSIGVYSNEKGPSKIKSPVSFNTAGLFGELPISSFNSQLYTDTPVNKENYFPFNCGSEPEDNRTAYHLQYSSFLEHKDWNLLQDVSTILPDELSNFEDLSMEPAENKKYSHIRVTSPNETSPLLPDKIGEHAGSFPTPLSEDDLEIKRLVSELENQLQTSRMDNDAIVAQESSKQYMNADMRHQTSPLTPLHLDEASGNTTDMYIPNHFISDGTDMHPKESCMDEVSISPKAADQSPAGKMEDDEDIWGCSFQLVSLADEPGFHTPTKDCESPLSPEGTCSEDNTKIKANEHQQSSQELSSLSPGSYYSDKPDEKLENEQYTENLIASLAIMSDTVLGKNMLQNDTERKETSQINHHENSSTSSGESDKPFTQSSEYGPFECDVSKKQSNNSTDLFTLEKSVPPPGLKADEAICDGENNLSFVNPAAEQDSFVNNTQQNITSHQSNEKTEASSILSESEEPSPIVTGQNISSKCSPVTKYKERSSDNTSLSFAAGSSTEELDSEKHMIHISQDPIVNPLQQLQLFVARTARNNEELMMMPCYPVQFPITNQSSNDNSNSEQSEDIHSSIHTTESATPVKDKNVGKSDYHILDTLGDTLSGEGLVRALCVSETIAEPVKENGNNKTLIEPIAPQPLTPQHLKEDSNSESKHAVVGTADSIEECGLVSLDLMNENASTVQGEQFGKSTDNALKADHSSVSLTFIGEENAEGVTRAVVDNEIADKSVEKEKQSLDVLELNLQPDEPHCPLLQTYTAPKQSEEKVAKEHLDKDKICECEPTLGIVNTGEKTEYQLCPNESRESIDGNTTSTDNSDHLPVMQKLTEPSEKDTVCSVANSNSEQPPLKLPEVFADISPVENDACEPQNRSKSSSGNVLNIQGCNKLSFMHLQYTSPNMKKTSLCCITGPQDKVMEGDIESKLPTKQAMNNDCDLDLVPIAESVSFDTDLSQKVIESTTNVTANDNNSTASNGSFLSKDNMDDKKICDPITSVPVSPPAYKQTNSNDHNLPEGSATTSHLFCGVPLENDDLCTSSKGSSVSVEHDEQCNCACIEILCPHNKKIILPSLSDQLVKMPSPSRNDSDLNIQHACPANSNSMEPLIDQYSDCVPGKESSAGKGRSVADSSAPIGERKPFKPEETLHYHLPVETFPSGIKEMEGNLFTDKDNLFINSESLTEDDKLCGMDQQKSEAVFGITDDAKQLKLCPDGLSDNQFMEISETFRDETVKESGVCEDPGLFLSEERTQTVMNVLGKVEDDCEGASRGDVLHSLEFSRTLNTLSSSIAVDNVANNSFTENTSKTNAQKLIEFSASSMQHNSQPVIMCEVCSASFRSKQGLMRHKAIKHRLKNASNQSKLTRIKANSTQTKKENIIWKEESKIFKSSTSENTCTIDQETCSLVNSVQEENNHFDQQNFLKGDKHVKENNSVFTSNETVVYHEPNEECVNNAEANTEETNYSSRADLAEPCIVQSGLDSTALIYKETLDAKKSNEGKVAKSKKHRQFKHENPKQNSNSVNTNNERQRKRQTQANTNAIEGNQKVEKIELATSLDAIGRPDDLVKLSPQSEQQMDVSCGPKESEACPLLQLQVMTESYSSTPGEGQRENTIIATNTTVKAHTTSEEWVSQEGISNSGNLSLQGKNCSLIRALLDDSQCEKERNNDSATQMGVGDVCSFSANIQDESHIKIEEETSEKEEVNLLQKDTDCQHSDKTSSSVFNSSVPGQVNGSPLKPIDADPPALTTDCNDETCFGNTQDMTASKHWREHYSNDLELPVLEAMHSNSESRDLSNLESAMSQIFPEENAVVRKKCPRVYGKRSKKHKVDTELNTMGSLCADSVMSDNEHIPTSFTKRPEQCEYATISIDDTIMLHISHNSKTIASKKSSACDEPKVFEESAHEHRSEDAFEGPELSEKDSGNAMELLYHQNCKMETMSEEAVNSTVWNSPQEAMSSTSTHGSITSFEAPSEKVTDVENRVPIIQNELELPKTLAAQLLEPYDSLASDQGNSADLGINGIQVLNHDYELSDRHLIPGSSVNKSSGFSISNTTSEEANNSIKVSKVRSEDGKMVKSRTEMSIKSKDKQYKCKVCFQWFLTIGELDFHKLSHNPSPPPTCYMCVQRKFSSREQLRDHLKEKHAKNKAGIWTCGMCLKEISDVWMYNEHLREHATQFARKGQAQKSVIGMPGCFSEDSAMKTFFNRILNKKPAKSTKAIESGTKSVTKENKVLKEHQEPTLKIKEQSEASVKNKVTFTSALKLSTSWNPEPVKKAESIQKNFSIHPDCKDPSRDCHHCGKQFPKPFKLQRHLVVHSLHKIYLCYKCPIFYLEMQELKAHLKAEHRVLEEPEIKHTTLYTCELCADVMHVIKKSFICSTCNYTFSKKEQYDRHMEKHLAGGSKAQKFRGVMRPHVPLQDGKFDPQSSLAQSCSSISSPPRKKQKISHNRVIEPSSENNIPTVSSINFAHTHLYDNSLPGPSDFLPEIVNTTTVKLHDLAAKRTDRVGDFSELLAEMEQSQLNIVPPRPCVSPAVCHSLSSDLHLVDLDGLPLANVDGQLYNMASSGSSAHTCAVKPNGSVAQGQHPAKDKLLQTESSRSIKQTHDLQKTSFSSQVKIEIAAIENTSSKPNAHECKPTDKHGIDSETKSNHKKRKEHKTWSSSAKSNGNYRISIVEGNKKRKPVRNDCIGTMRKADIPHSIQSISTAREEPAGGHLTSRPKPWTNNPQPKKNGIDLCPPKRLEIRSSNGEHRRKKELISKPLLHSKGGSQSVNSSIKKHRLIQGVKLVESRNYRTAESQSNLLSQLFGQKITSFKIPLRKDISE